MKSVFQKNKECFVCEIPTGLEDHHIFFGRKNKNVSEKYGLKVWLCSEHHRGKYSAHLNRNLDLTLKEIAQRYYEGHIGTREQFIKEIGRSYL